MYGNGERGTCGEGQAFQGQADCVEGVDCASSRGFDDGSNVGVELCAPFGTEAVCHLSEDDAGTQRLFGAVVGGRNGSVGEEDEHVASALLDHALQLVALAMCWGGAEQSIELGVQLVAVGT